MQTILIIEDEPELVQVLRTYLERAGYRVLTSYKGDTGLATWQNNRPDLVILDLNLPGMDGLDVARAIRRQADTPIIMVTARVEETDELIGLELGADDYISKPFSPRAVVARVRSVLRRFEAPKQAARLLILHDLEIDLAGHQVRRAGQPLELTPTEFNLLVALAEQPGRVFTRLQLLEASQGEAYEGYERTIDAHIKNLRRKLGDDARAPRLVLTVYGRGYAFAEDQR
jgi:DNA-binding response OmpR family regulator